MYFILYRCETKNGDTKLIESSHLIKEMKNNHSYRKKKDFLKKIRQVARKTKDKKMIEFLDNFFVEYPERKVKFFVN